MLIYSDRQRPILRVSNSDIMSHKRCPRKWTWQSFNRRNLTVKKPVPHLWIGTGCHYALEHWKFYGGTKELTEAFDEWTTEQFAELQRRFGIIPRETWTMLDAVRVLGREVLQNYEKYARKNDKFKFVARELDFSVPIPYIEISLRRSEGSDEIAEWVLHEWGENFTENADFKKTYIDRGLYDAVNQIIPALFVGRLDGLVQMASDPDHYYVIDHKFLARPVAEETLLLDEQTAKYVWATRQALLRKELPVDTGLIVGCYYNVIMKKVPAVPKANKNGETSKAKITTTVEVFMDTLRQRGQNPNDYAEQITALRGSETKFYARHRIMRGSKEIALVGDRLYYEYLAMHNTHQFGMDSEHPGIVPNPTKDCAWECQFKHACYAATSGADAEFILAESFMTSERTYYFDHLENQEPAIE